MIKRVFVADSDILVTSTAQRCFNQFKEVSPIFTADLSEGLRQLSDSVLHQVEPGSPALYGAVIECLWPDAKTPSPRELEMAGLTRDAREDYQGILEKGQELYSSSPPLGLLLAMRADKLKVPVVLTIYPTSRLNAQVQISPVQEYADSRGWKCYAPGKADKSNPDFWKKCLTRFDNKWLERGYGPQVGESDLPS